MLDKFEKNSLKAVAKGLLFLGGLGAAVYLIRALGAEHLLDTEWIDLNVKGKGLVGAGLYVAVSAACMALGLPRQVFCFLGGYAYGFALGTALGLGASSLGCLMAVLFARIMGRDLVAGRFGPRLKRINQAVSKSPFTTAMVIRFLPVGSNLFTNLAAGVSDMSIAAFVLGSTVGYLPQTLVFALFGSGVNVSSTARIVLSVALFIASAALGVYLYKRRRAAGQLPEDNGES